MKKNIITEPASQPASQHRNSNLDLLRFLACVAVVGLHISIKDLSAVNAVLYYLCGFAVPLFFMASGYMSLVTFYK